MTFAITGLSPEAFATMFALSDAELAARGARRVIADADRGYPCRVSLQDAKAGERLLLVNHVSNAVDGPYRSAFAIFVREEAAQGRYVDELPPVFHGRPLSLRGYDAEGDLVAARLSLVTEEHTAGILDLFADPRIHHIDAHNAAHGCFAARIEREGDAA
jgi:hypothetical protein